MTDLQWSQRAPERRLLAVHAGRFSEQHLEWQVDRSVPEMRVFEHEALFLSGLADDCERATLAFAELLEGADAVGGDGEDVALLGFIAPDLQRAHAGLVVRDLAQVETPAAPAVVDEFREGIGNTAGADIVDEGDGVFRAKRPATVDDLLAAALHLGVVALDAGEIEILVAVAAARRSSTVA